MPGIEERRKNMPRTLKEAALRWGNDTGRPTYTKETPKAARQNEDNQAPIHLPILNAPSSERRARSPRKSLSSGWRRSYKENVTRTGYEHYPHTTRHNKQQEASTRT